MVEREEESVAETERKAVLAWVAGQLSWERRLRELESSPAAESDEATTGLD